MDRRAASRCYTQAVLQGAFILAKATGGPRGRRRLASIICAATWNCFSISTKQKENAQ